MSGVVNANGDAAANPLAGPMDNNSDDEDATSALTRMTSAKMHHRNGKRSSDGSQGGSSTDGTSANKRPNGKNVVVVPVSSSMESSTSQDPTKSSDISVSATKALQRLSGEHHQIEVHTLKRVMHSAKLSAWEKARVLPSRFAKNKHVHIQVCVRSLATAAETNHSDVEAAVKKIADVPDAVVNAGSASGHSIEDRLRHIISDTRARLADNGFRRVWDFVHMLTIFFFYAISLVFNVMYLDFDYEDKANSWQFICFMLIEVFWIADLIMTTQMFTIDSDGRLVKQVKEIVAARKWVIVIDVIGILPVDYILQGFGVFVPFLVFRLFKVVKLLRVTYLYEIVNRDIITPSTVTFFFQYKPIITGLFWLCSFIHACAVAHNLIDQYEIRPRQFNGYAPSLVAVCIMLSGSNATVEVYTTADKLLCIPLAVLSLFGQGVLVGKLTALVFRNSVSAENYQLMRDTLGIVRHYKVPNSIQREVLSYQMHALNDDVARHMRNLETLPQQMQHEIMLYIKIDAVSKVKIFATASKDCRMKLAASLRRVVVEPEVEVVRFGEVGDEMYMVAHGYADVILGTGKIVTTFTRGDCFGEMALVQKSCTRTATVRALTYCDMWTLDKGNFLEALASFPSFLQGIIPELQKRDTNIDELKQSVAAVQRRHLEEEEAAEEEDVDSDDEEKMNGLDIGLQRGLVRQESALMRVRRSTGGLGLASSGRARLNTIHDSADPMARSGGGTVRSQLANKTGETMDNLEAEIQLVKQTLADVKRKSMNVHAAMNDKKQ